MTVRELIEVHAKRLREADTLSPEEASQRAISLTALLASINAELAQKESEYKVVLFSLLGGSKSVAEAKLKAEAQPEFLAWKEREVWRESCLEMVRTLKSFVRNATEERKMQ
jgi:hypothetical protein